MICWLLLTSAIASPHTARVHIINLRHRRDRLASIVRQLANATLPATWDMDIRRVDAVTPRGTQDMQAYPHWKTTSTNARYGRFWSRPVTNGELACFASHVRALNGVMREPAAMSFVMEDDAEFRLKRKKWVMHCIALEPVDVGRVEVARLVLR